MLILKAKIIILIFIPLLVYVQRIFCIPEMASAQVMYHLDITRTMCE